MAMTMLECYETESRRIAENGGPDAGAAKKHWVTNLLFGADRNA
jgi:hypothetical protein